MFFGFEGGGGDGCGKADLKDRAFQGGAFDGEGGVVGVGDPAGDGEAEAAAGLGFSLA